MKTLFCFIGLFVITLAGAVPGAAAESVIRVAAASSMRTSMAEIAALYTKHAGSPVRLSFASSGILRRQIARGAPFDLFMSADETLVSALVAERLTRDQGTVYAEGRLALMVSRHSGLPTDATLTDIVGYMDQHAGARFAIANPGHVPYGRAAKQVLTSLGQYDQLAPRLVTGESIAQAAQFIISGSAPAGLVSLSLARMGSAKDATFHAVLPARLHTPIKHRMVVLRKAAPETLGLYDFILSKPARTILVDHGFAVPGP